MLAADSTRIAFNTSVIQGGYVSSRLIRIPSSGGLSSEWIIPACVRPCVRPSVPLLGEAQNICFCTILSEISENHLCILQYLATVAFKTHLHLASIGQERSCAGCRVHASGRLDQGFEAPPGKLDAVQKALAALFHEPGHTCLLFDLIWAY